MRYSVHNLAVAAALIASAASVFAEQQFGRDSVYANPAQAARQVRVDDDAGVEARFGRDSVYATASSRPSSPVAEDVTELQRYGRASVYAIPLDTPAGDLGRTQVGRAPSDRGTN
jgi:hypothetical protein